MILFSGGEVRNRANPADPTLTVTDNDARAAGWRDFSEVLTADELTLFLAPNARGELTLSPAGQARLIGPQANALHPHIRVLMRAIENPDRRLYVMPVPVYQQMPANFRWVTDVAMGTHGNRGFRITINGYGQFPVEWIDLRTALGRSHLLSATSPMNACIYGTIFDPNPIAPPLVAQWQRTRLAGRRRSDTADIWFEREDTVTLFHELLVHVIRGFGHEGPYDENVEQWARAGWQANNP